MRASGGVVEFGHQHGVFNIVFGLKSHGVAGGPCNPDEHQEREEAEEAMVASLARCLFTRRDALHKCRSLESSMSRVRLRVRHGPWPAG